MEALDTANTRNGHGEMQVTFVVPLQLCSTKTSTDKFILWHIPRPSVSYCRPIRKKFKKETVDLATK